MILAAYVPSAVAYSLIGFLVGLCIGISLGYLYWNDHE